jgi:hypothetical protein
MALSLSFQPAEGKIIYARSPILYKFEGATPASYTYLISLSATTGQSSTLAEYVTINRTPDLDNFIIIDVGNIVKNYIRTYFSNTTENAIYLQVACIEYDGTNVNSTVLSNVSIVTYGYTNYLDGFNKNYQTTAYSYPLSSVPETIYLPQYGGTGNSYAIAWANVDPNTLYSIYYYSGGTYSNTSYYFPVVSDGKSNITDIYVGYDDMRRLHGIEVDQNTEMLLVVEDWVGGTLKQYKIKPETCNGNDLHVLKFINKFGAWDRIFIKGKVEETATNKSETYKYNKVNHTSMAYVTDGSYHKLFTNGKSGYKLNTGWISESMNPVLDELMLSEHVFYDGKPCIVKDTDITYKTHRFDKLINYLINIELAYDKLNNII